MSLPAILLTIFLSIAGMELFAWWAQKYVMHGWGWGWHESHHVPTKGPFEKKYKFETWWKYMVYIKAKRND